MLGALGVALAATCERQTCVGPVTAYYTGEGNCSGTPSYYEPYSIGPVGTCENSSSSTSSKVVEFNPDFFTTIFYSNPDCDDNSPGASWTRGHTAWGTCTPRSGGRSVLMYSAQYVYNFPPYAAHPNQPYFSYDFCSQPDICTVIGQPITEMTTSFSSNYSCLNDRLVSTSYISPQVCYRQDDEKPFFITYCIDAHTAHIAYYSNANCSGYPTSTSTTRATCGSGLLTFSCSGPYYPDPSVSPPPLSGNPSDCPTPQSSSSRVSFGALFLFLLFGSLLNV